MNKNRIRLSESQLHRVIKECVKKVLKENNDKELFQLYHMASSYISDGGQMNPNAIIDYACKVLKGYPQFSSLCEKCANHIDDDYSIIEEISGCLGEYFND